MSITRKRGFTLIEMLVVMVIIAVLAGVLLPAIMKSMRQAKTNRCLSEMQHLATVVTQVYNDVGYYVPLNDMIEAGTTNVNVWLSSDYATGTSDENLTSSLLSGQTTANMWAGPYTTYKEHYNNRPLDPWALGTSANANLHQLRMFWTKLPSLKPAGASGTMVLIAAGADGKYKCGIDSDPVNAGLAQFANFNPSTDPAAANYKSDDIYFVFNAGIQ